MNISPQKMTFLAENYGLTPEQITQFYQAYCRVDSQLGGEIEFNWQESGWTPDNPEAAMIECLCDADRLADYIEDYDAWCFDFLMKQELAHDLIEVPMPKHLLNYLSSQGKKSWQQIRY